MTQQSLLTGYQGVSCKFSRCPLDVVGSSTTGKGHVCKHHNELEWSRALKKYDPPLSRDLARDAVLGLTIPLPTKETVE